MNPGFGRAKRRGLFLVAALAGLFLPPIGCDGGTSTDAGNPELVLSFQDANGPVSFTGDIYLYPQDVTPEFFTLPADDGYSGNAWISYKNPVRIFVIDKSSFTLSPDMVSSMAFSRPQVPLLKGAAAPRVTASAGNLPPFNVMLVGAAVGSAELGISEDAEQHKYRHNNGVAFDKLPMDLSALQTCHGRIDTAGWPHVPFILFVPGSPIYTHVTGGDSFQFTQVPSGRLPLRLISTKGVVFLMQDSLGAGLDKPLKPGQRYDSMALPKPAPTLDPPMATPSGQFGFSDSVEVKLNAQLGSTIYYSTDGSMPGLSSTRYAGPLLFRASVTLKSIAFLKGYNRSPISVNNYVLLPAAPMAVPAAMQFTDSLAITLKTTAVGAQIHYTLNGPIPVPGGDSTLAYSKPFVIRATTLVRALAVQPGVGESKVMEANYILLPSTTRP